MKIKRLGIYTITSIVGLTATCIVHAGNNPPPPHNVQLLHPQKNGWSADSKCEPTVVEHELTAKAQAAVEIEIVKIGGGVTVTSKWKEFINCAGGCQRVIIIRSIKHYVDGNQPDVELSTPEIQEVGGREQCEKNFTQTPINLKMENTGGECVCPVVPIIHVN